MFKDVTAKTFDRNDHRLFMPCMGHDRATVKAVRQNRRTLQAYLYAIQKRLDRGQRKGANALYQRMLQQSRLRAWAQAAIRNELITNPDAQPKPFEFVVTKTHLAIDCPSPSTTTDEHNHMISHALTAFGFILPVGVYPLHDFAVAIAKYSDHPDAKLLSRNLINVSKMH